MNFSSHFRTFQYLILVIFSFLAALGNLSAQLCLGIDIRPDETNPEEVFLDITTQEFEGVASMQFSLNFNPEDYDFIDLVNSNLRDFNRSNISDSRSTGVGTTEKYVGAVIAAWFDPSSSGVTYTDNAPLLTLKFKKLKAEVGGFEFSDTPLMIEIAACDPLNPTICQVIFNFENCNTGDLLVPGIKGKLILDENKNCLLEESEGTRVLENWRGWQIVASQNGEYYFSGTPQKDGSYSVKTFPGENLIEVFPPSRFYSVCEAAYTINTDEINTDSFFNHLLQIKEECSFLQVSLGNLAGQPCDESFYLVGFQNNGTAAASDVYIELTLDYRVNFLEMNADFTDLGDNNFRIEIGDLGVGESGVVFIQAEVPCELSSEETIRNEAHIYPLDDCSILTEEWSGASLKINGKCEDNQIIFDLQNIGDGDMSAPLEYVVIEDAVIFRTGQVQLPKGANTIVTIPANGASYFIQIPQEPGHPGNNSPSAFVEACGRDQFGDFSTGFANRFPEENKNHFVAIDYQLLNNSTNFNQLSSSPIGYSDHHLLEPDKAIEYTLHFTNGSSAFQIIDTLSQFLDLTTFEPVAANNPYEYTLERGVLTLTIPPMVSGSFLDRNSYVKFSLFPKADLPMGTIITNEATVLYADESSEKTNAVFHTIEEDFLEKLTDIEEVEERFSTVSIYPNPATDVVTFKIKNYQPINYEIIILDIDGKIIQTTAFNNNLFQFYKKDLPGGTYLYQLKGENGQVEHGFFVLID